MEVEDAAKWARSLEKELWKLYTPQPDHSKEEERRKRIKTRSRVLIVPAWILNLLYIFIFGKQLFTGTGWILYHPALYLAAGVVLAGLLTFAQTLFAERGGEQLQ